MNELRKFKVSIDGQTYTLMSDESETVVLESVARFNLLLQELKQKNPTIERYQAAIIAAMNVLNQLIQIEKSIEAVNSTCHLLAQEIDVELASN